MVTSTPTGFVFGLVERNIGGNRTLETGLVQLRPTAIASRVTNVINSNQNVSFDNGVIDISIVPFIRSQLIEFTASGLRPQRRVWFFFDDVDITSYILESNTLELDDGTANNTLNGGFSNTDTFVTSTGNTSILAVRRFYDFTHATPSLQDDGSARRRRKLVKFSRTPRSATFANAQNFTTSTTGVSGVIAGIKVKSAHFLEDFFQNSSANSIVLPRTTIPVANNYWGTNGANSVILYPNHQQKRKAVRAYITGFDNVSRRLYLSNTLTQLITNNPDAELPTSNADADYAWTIDTGEGFYTDREGKIEGTFHVPSNMFRTGERVFRIIDTPTNEVADCTTRAETTFNAFGLAQNRNKVKVSTPSTRTVTKTRQIRTTNNGNNRSDGNRVDPVAQTFFVDEELYPKGIFVSSVDLFFRSADPILPVEVQIRPTVNGYPHSYEVVQDAIKSLDAEDVNTSQDASVPTKFKFDSPIFLEPGEYAIVVVSSSINYEVFISELGQKIIGSDRIVSEQPYLGSFFKSQNSSTWDAIQLQDLKFRLYKCRFVTSGSVTMVNALPDVGSAIMDNMYTHIEDRKLPGTTLDYSYSLDSGGTYNSYVPDTNEIIQSGRTTISSAGQYRFKFDMTTDDVNLSPVVYNKTGNALAIQNYINNASLSASDFVVANTGGGYQANANLGMTITASYGSGANGFAQTDSTGKVISVALDAEGSGYISNATVVITASNATTTNASITFVGETSPSGGPILAKYITRTVTLAEGFDAGDLKIYLTAYRPSGTDIKVYFKVKNANDNENFADKPYQLMNMDTGSTVYSKTRTYDDVIEYKFETQIPSNAISYSTSTATFTNFNQFAIKIALLSNDTTNYPVVHDMRAIALPALTTS
jgi:hypothetical protein